MAISAYIIIIFYNIWKFGLFIKLNIALGTLRNNINSFIKVPDSLPAKVPGNHCCHLELLNDVLLGNHEGNAF